MKKYFLFFFLVLGLLFISNKPASAKAIQVCYKNGEIQAAFFKSTSKHAKGKHFSKYCISYFKYNDPYEKLKSILRKGMGNQKYARMNDNFKYHINSVDYANFTYSYNLRAFKNDVLIFNGQQTNIKVYCDTVFKKYKSFTKAVKYQGNCKDGLTNEAYYAKIEKDKKIKKTASNSITTTSKKLNSKLVISNEEINKSNSKYISLAYDKRTGTRYLAASKRSKDHADANALLKCKFGVQSSKNKCEIVDRVEGKQRRIILDDKSYDWYVVVKHPSTDYEFIASKVSTEKVAKEIALKKCFNFVRDVLKKNTSENLNCKIDLVVNGKKNTKLAEKIILKQNQQVEQIALKGKTIDQFKPNISKGDNKPPKLIVKKEYKFNKSNYKFSGEFEDESDRIFIDVNGRIVEATGGKFTIDRFSPVNEKLKIVAIDEWGSKSEVQIVNINIELNDTIVAEKLDPLNPSNIRTTSNNNKVALIIGIENYSDAPAASYANLDAKYFYEYSKQAFGVKPNNINLLIDEDATFVKTSKAITKWLKGRVKKNQSDLIIFFAGHGLASNDGKELYLLPQDSDPDLLSRTALSRTELFQEIIALKPKSVTMFFDACYSGQSRENETLIASARPIRIVADDQNNIPNNFTIFSASQLDQISSGLKDAEHGIFSYFLMKGLEGNADQNDDRKITNGELLAYMDDNISQKASELGRQQNPSLAGDPNKVLSTY